MNAFSFSHRYTDSSPFRKKWIIKMLQIELQLSERQVERYISEKNEDTIPKKIYDTIEKVLSFSEKTLDYRLLPEKLPIIECIS